MRFALLPLLAAAALADVGHDSSSVDPTPIQPADGRVWVYNAAHRRWESTPGGWTRGVDPKSNAVFCDGRYFVWGAHDAPGSGISAFDARRRAWERIEPPPIAPRSFFGASIQGPRFAVWGGTRDAKVSLADGALYDFASKKWRKIPEAPLAARTAPGVAWIGRRLFVWGGYTLGGTDGYAEDGAVFDLDKGAWRKVSDAGLRGRTVPLVASIKNKVFVWGGFGDAEWLADGAIYDADADRWEAAPRSPLSARSGSGLAVSGTRVYLIFGDGPGQDLRDSAVFDLDGGRWRKLPDAPIDPRHDPAVALSAGRLYVWGGFNSNGGRPVDAAVFDPGADRWERIPDAPAASEEDRVFYR